MMWLEATESALLASVSSSVKWGCFELREFPGLCLLPRRGWGRAPTPWPAGGIVREPRAETGGQACVRVLRRRHGTSRDVTEEEGQGGELGGGDQRSLGSAVLSLAAVLGWAGLCFAVFSCPVLALCYVTFCCVMSCCYVILRCIVACCLV